MAKGAERFDGLVQERRKLVVIGVLADGETQDSRFQQGVNLLGGEACADVSKFALPDAFNHEAVDDAAQSDGMACDGVREVLSCALGGQHVVENHGQDHALLEQELEHGMEKPVETGDHAVSRVQYFGEAVDQNVCDFPDGVVENLAFAVEVLIEGGAGDAATVRDLLVGDAVISLLGKELDRLGDDGASTRFMVDDDAHSDLLLISQTQHRLVQYSIHQRKSAVKRVFDVF